MTITTEQLANSPEELAEWEKGDSVRYICREQIPTLLGEVDCLFHLHSVYRQWEGRMKQLAAERLKPGTDEVITDVDALDYLWDLGGDYSWSSNQTEPFRHRALDYYLGRKVEHIWGTGVIVKMRDKGYGIRVRLACMTEGCRNRITVYARPGCHNGAFCYVYDRDGKYLADLRNQSFECKTCHRGRKK